MGFGGGFGFFSSVFKNLRWAVIPYSLDPGSAWDLVYFLN
jgi:hypothetical protein